MDVVLRLLGEVRAEVDGRPVELGTPRQRCVLAALAVDAGRPVPVDRLVERVWGVQGARRARATLHSYVSRLRQALADVRGVGIVRRSGGYAVVVDTTRAAVDLHRFHDLCARARDDEAQAVRWWEEALALWRGEALTGLDGEWAQSQRDLLAQERLAAEHSLVDAQLRAGCGARLVAGLSARTAEHPLDERVAGQYLLALHRAGRTTDALEHYRRVRTRLVEELATEPGAALRELHRRILADDPALAPSGTGTTTAGATPADVVVEPVVPRQLPAAPASFVGRRGELDRLDAALADPAAAGTVVVSAVAGAGGIGKTWLVLRWAHRNLDRFPDGQLFVDLRGFSPDSRPVPPAAAVRGFLDALGGDTGHLPPDLDAQAALYRSLVADKRMLIVLDNAATADQVTPLLPGTPTCTVLVTGRRKLASLIDRYGARHLQLDVLSRQESRALFVERLGEGRVAAEPDVVDELVGLCGRHPLALAVTARHADIRPQTALAEVADALRDLGLDMLDDDDPTASLPAVLSWSLRSLTAEQRTAFALLGIAPGPDVDLAAATSLTGLPEARARKVLGALEDRCLLDRRPHGRYSMHDLLRAYAATTAHETLPEQARRAASARVVDFYLHTALAADRLLNPHRPSIPFDPPTPGALPHPLPDHPAALAWLDTHHPHLLAAQHVAAAHHRHRVVCHLAWSLGTFHRRRGHRHDVLAMWRVAADAAAHLTDTATHALVHRCLGLAHIELGAHDQGIDHLRRALDLAEEHGDPRHRAHVHGALSHAWMRRGDDRRALEHARLALDLHRSLDEPVRQADALNVVGWLTARLGDYDTARDHCLAALALHRQHRNLDGEADAEDSLGLIDHRTGRHDQATHRYLRALALFRTLGNSTQVAATLDNLGHPNAALGRHDQARAAWREALELYLELGHDADAARVRRQLDALGAVPEPRRKPDTSENTRTG